MIVKYCRIDRILLPLVGFTSHSAFSNLMRTAIMSQNVANPSMFPLPNRIQY